MIEKKNINKEQLDTINAILKRLKESKVITLEDGSSAKVKINEAYLFDDFTVDIASLDDDPENNAGFIDVNDCAYYIHFGTLINASIDKNTIFFPSNKIPLEYKNKGYDYLYLDKDLVLNLA